MKDEDRWDSERPGRNVLVGDSRPELKSYLASDLEKPPMFFGALFPPCFVRGGAKRHRPVPPALKLRASLIPRN